jgi:hypothetical protein
VEPEDLPISLEGASIVLIGSFNPAIFQPAWFAAQNLLSKPDVEAAQIQIIHPRVTHFKTDRFELLVDDGTFRLLTQSAAEYDPLRDLAAGTFRLLRHTPLSMMGINRTVHMRVETKEAWDTVGHKLAPKAFWRPILDRPGMRSIAIQGERTDGHQGRVTVKVEPSIPLLPKFGVFVEINDHFESSRNAEQRDALELISILEQEWLGCQRRAQMIIEHVASLIRESEHDIGPG